MKLCIYDWALHTAGGGQRISCQIAEYFSRENEVDLLTLFETDKKKLEFLYGVNLSKVNLKAVYAKGMQKKSAIVHLFSFNRISKISKNYDFFFNSDGHETVRPLSKNSALLCHFPERKWYRKPRNFFDFFALSAIFLFKSFLKNYASSYDTVLCNSKYGQKWIKKLWKITPLVLTLPINFNRINQKKEDIILSVGRLTADKNYEFMINCFKQIYESGIQDYEYLIVGLINNLDYLNKLIELSNGYPIRFLTDIKNQKLNRIYAKSKIFFHTKGFGIVEQKNPQDLEHFGLVTVEAMNQGCVPIVFNGGGQKEIVDNGKNGFLFNREEEAIKYIKKIIREENLRKKLSAEAKERADFFSMERFHSELDSILP